MKKFKLFAIACLIVIVGVLLIFNPFKKEKIVAFDYTPYIKTSSKQPIYKYNGKEFTQIGEIAPNTIVNITDSRKDNNYKLADSDYYTAINNVVKASPVKETLNYQSYIPFNEAVKAKDLNLYNKDGDLAYSINDAPDLSIIIKDKDKYYVKFNNQLLYAKPNEVSLITTNAPEVKLAKDVPVFMYHYFYDKNKGETAKNANYMEIHNFENQLKYIKDNHVFAMNMDDLELFLDKKINIPDKSAVLTMDDGHISVRKYVHPLLSKYKVNAVAFLITKKVKNIKDYQNPYMQLESHTNAMHTWGCQGGRGGLMRCIPVKDGVADLKKSSEIIGGAKVLAYPYGDYTKTAIQILKDAGFTMAFTIEPGKAKPGMDKLLLPRVRMSTNTTLQAFIDAIED